MKKILIQLDTDPHPSVFDRVVAVDAGADQVFSYGGVAPDDVTPLIHGAIFTRGPAELQHTAVFVGGSDVAAGEALLRQVRATFFGPMRVSVMMDSNGCNSTAAAAVRAAAKHVELAGAQALVLGGTGPVGQRAGLILARQGAVVRLASRSRERAAAACQAIREKVPDARITPCALAENPLAGISVLIAAGAAGAQLLTAHQRQSQPALRVAIDLNAVPPAGLSGIDIMDKAVQRGDCTCYGAIGVGGSKMKIHKAALRTLFDANDHVLDTAEIYAIAQGLG